MPTISKEPRFTIDGSDYLEGRLKYVCDQVRQGLFSQIPESKINAIVLGGGYGRGEGGVLQTSEGDQPYNDLEFYVFMRGNRLWNERRYGKRVHELATALSNEAGLQVEFKIDGAARWRTSPVSMFSYDLVGGHRLLFGEESIFCGCQHHLKAESIPLSEATRLMFNRCSGLLLCRDYLRKGSLTHEEADFVGRNLAKAQLALGDAILTAFAQYHWSVRERHRRLMALATSDWPAGLPDIQAHHAAGVAFKLHPSRVRKSVADFDTEHRQLTNLAMRLWLWLEERRLNQSFSSASDYALSELDKCPSGSAWQNYILSLRTFGPNAMLERASCRYPRGRLFNALALLLWHAEAASQPQVLKHLQRELQTDAPDWPSLVAVFKRIWLCYG